MTNQAIIDLIRDNLPHLVHPGGGKGPIPLALPMFRNSAIPADVAKQMAAEAGLPSLDVTTLTAEAIVALLDQAGYDLSITKDQVAQLRADAASGVERHRTPTVHCTCGTPLFKVNIDADKPTTNGPALIKAMSQMNPECSAQHRRKA
ncbi:hypothetical protein A5761_15080 [Mycolicibacterium setense]|uniref:hypothetical protein n=1 Tax=Mycolicibacterium setense TaxID=431269 RepID=UPI0007E936E4|nr:hypothetical protein [Mycolicibacterium setense]OBB15063.1 hypothetical protein A5761_15080 [Mycolicibacterium setense]